MPAAVPAAQISAVQVSSVQHPHSAPTAQQPPATPIARRMAEEHALDLNRIEGSGPGGRILRGDVEQVLAHAAVQPVPEAATAVASTQATAPAEEPRTDRLDSSSALRQAIAARMTQSKQTIPHFYITSAVIMDDALALRAQINASLSTGDSPDDYKVTVNDLVVKATALALRQYPALNASVIDDQIVHHPDINVGTAVAVAGGLLVVVSPEADRRTISEIARTNHAMIQRARAGKVKPADVNGGTFTVSNLGAYQTEHFAAIINPPQAAILGVATARKTPLVIDDEIVVRTVMHVTLSADHRVTDGAEGARFLQTLRTLLEDPIKLLI